MWYRNNSEVSHAKSNLLAIRHSAEQYSIIIIILFGNKIYNLTIFKPANFVLAGTEKENNIIIFYRAGIYFQNNNLDCKPTIDG